MGMNSLVKLVVSSVAVMTVACTLAVLLVPPPVQEGRHRRDREARDLLNRISKELWKYRQDHGEFPAGNGKGSVGLSQALLELDSDGAPYLSLGMYEMSADGSIINPATLQKTLIHYRNNRLAGVGEYAGHNSSSFDLWCHDARGIPGGLNNWE